ncbi:hypothetical protein MMC21_001528 [Puttea exsequens]|nr:hypothetical protein [Puttea exsequens]
MRTKETSNFDIHPESTLDDELSFFTNGMDPSIGNITPHIKNENEDSFLPHDYPSYGGNNMSNSPFGQGPGGNVNPLDLTMPDGNYGQFHTGAPQNMSSSFNYGRSGIQDDELLDFDLNDTSGQHGYQHGQSFMPNQTPSTANGQAQFNQYSSTPDGAPIQSPFAHANFNYGPFSSQMQQQPMRPNPLQMQNGQVHARSSSYMAPGMDRQHSNSKSPMTPKTPGLGALHLGNGTPESGSLPSQPIPSNLAQRHQNRLSAQMDTPGSLSYLDSPMTSPAHAANHAQISDIIKSGKHASLPAKVEGGHHGPAYQTQEAKRRRRRESHNLVERRRRDNINEKIQELSHLVPMHRLEDEKVRKHIMNNSPLSPTLAATGRSPEQATSLLAGGGRRATTAGNISMGIPPDEKDKGPNKGDILNGAVSWTRDLMWALHMKLQQESELAEYIASLGGTFPFGQTEDDKRMRTELLNAMQENDPSSFSYTRAPGTGLRVPEHTNTAGEPLDPANMGIHSPQSLSPGQQSGGSGHHQFGSWHPSFKEEDEYGMEMS